MEEDLKKTYREGETGVRKAGRSADGEDLSDKLANLGDDIRKNLGNAGDDLSKAGKDADEDEELR